MQHPETVELTLKQIGCHLVKYMFFNAADQSVAKASERLVESIASNCELILQSLYDQLLRQATENKPDQLLETISLINYALNVMLKN